MACSFLLPGELRLGKRGGVVSGNLNKKEEAYELYKSGHRLKDIATQLEISEGTLRSWKSREKWDKSNAKTLQQKNATLQRRKQKIKKEVEDVSIKEINQVIVAEELSDKEQLFCLYHIRCFNATKAYMKAYGVKYESAAVLGCRLLKQEKIQATIKELKQNRLNREMLSEEDIFQKYMDIAFADMSDYFDFGSNNNANYGKLKNSDEVDGTLISEIKISSGKTQSVSVKLLDRMKALDWLSEHMDMATEEQKVRIEMLRSKTQSDEDESIEDDGFLEALNSSAKEDWSDEED